MLKRKVIDLLEISWIRKALSSRLFQPFFLSITLVFFTIAIFTGIFGSPVGSQNFSIVYIWIVWWALLMIVLVPLLGRFWCTVCPLPAPAEWMQRRSIVQKVTGKLHSLNYRWPRQLKNIWLQTATFLSMALFSTIILTRPSVTAWVLLGMMLMAVLLSVFYEKRVFCRYVCPVGGFIGLYSMVSPIELRVKDQAVCQVHTSNDCVTGNAKGYGCPWMVYPGQLERNTYCGLCSECIKTCTEDNISLNIRPLKTDLFVIKGRKLDEAYKILIMMTCALVYSGVLLGPWGEIKLWANFDSFGHWLTYAVGFLTTNIVLVPGLFLGAVWIAKKLSGNKANIKKQFIDYVYSLVPLGLAGWVAFSLGFLLINGSYAMVTLSDPFGWGWNLFGTANVAWQPIFSGVLPYIQTLIINIGLIAAIFTTIKISRQQFLSRKDVMKALIPLAGFQFSITLGFTYLFLG